MLINFLRDQLIWRGNGLIFPSQDRDSLLRKVWKNVKTITFKIVHHKSNTRIYIKLYYVWTAYNIYWNVVDTALGNLWKCFFLPLVVSRSDYQPGHGLCCQSYHERSAWVTKRSWGMNGLIFPSQDKDSCSRTCNWRKCFSILAPNNCDRWTN